MENTLDKIVTFFRVSPIQQMLSLVSTAPTAYLSYRAIKYYSQENIDEGIKNVIGALACIGYFLFNECLAIVKMLEYDKVKSALYEHGWDKRIIEPKSHTWCQRNMTQVASDDTGFGKETRDYLYEKGYRWYHFRPDV